MSLYSRNSNISRSGLLARRWLLEFAKAGLAIACCASVALATDSSRTLTQYVHDSWSIDRGFPDETVTSIAQTGDGYLWIGTNKSLIRFDGLNFQKVPQAVPTSLPIGAVKSLRSDGQGNLWILLPTTKLLRYHEGTFEVVRGEAENGVTVIGNGARDSVLISSVAMGIFSYNGNSFVSISSSNLSVGADVATDLPWSTPAWSTGLKAHHLVGPASGVISIESTNDGRVWLGTEDGGLLCLDRGRISRVGNLAGARINSILANGNSELWLGTSKGLYQWNGAKITHVGIPSRLEEVEVLSLIWGHDANIWVGTNHGLVRLSFSGKFPSVNAVPANSGPVTALFEDRELDIWIGGRRGLQRLRDSAFVTYSIGSAAQNTGAIYGDSEDRIWTAPIGGGLRWLKEREQGEVKIAGLDRDVVYSIAGGERNELWLGRQRGGLTRLRYLQGVPRAKTYTQADGLAQDSVYAVYRDRGGTIWSGTLNGGVSALRDGQFTTYTTANGLASNTVSSITEDADGTMWFGTPNGVSALAKGVWRTYTVRDGLNSPDVNCLLVDSKGSLWIGTANGLVLRKGEKIQVPPKMPAALHEPIFGIGEDKNGQLWIATAGHIVEVNPILLTDEPGKELEVREFTLSDGLRGTEGVKRFRSVIADTNGRVWVSTNGGLSAVSLARGAEESPPAQVHITEVSADGSSLDVRDPLRIPSAKERITFRFVGLSLRNPDRVRYRYRLDAFDQEWSEASANREAAYGNLRPGSYRFLVMACNSDGIWDGAEARIAFSVEPTLMQTWWFRVLLLVGAGLLVAAIYQFRMHQRSQRLAVRFEERLAERTRIARELHDTLLQSFQGLLMRFQAVSNELAEGEPKQELDEAIERAARAITEGRDAVQGLRSSVAESNDLAAALGALGKELAADESRPPEFTMQVEGARRDLHPVLRDEVYRVAGEALRNAFRHADARRIEVEIRYDERQFRLRVRDDGKGIDPRLLADSGTTGHFGLRGIRERAERVGAKLTVWSSDPRSDGELQSGTEVELSIPAARAYERFRAPHRSWLAEKLSSKGREMDS
jgi:signal transduction histidine kinase/ligand-binding sensor domain-containing protein